MEKVLYFLDCGKEPLIISAERKIPPRWEKPLRTVSLLRYRLWLTETSLLGLSCSEVLAVPEGLSRERVAEKLKEMRWRRLRWLAWLAFIFPFTWLLTPIPGPNIPFFYVLGRLYLHFSSFHSLGKLLKNLRIKVYSSLDLEAMGFDVEKLKADCSFKR